MKMFIGVKQVQWSPLGSALLTFHQPASIRFYQGEDVSKLFVIVFPPPQIIEKIWVSCILKWTKDSAAECSRYYWNKQCNVKIISHHHFHHRVRSTSNCQPEKLAPPTSSVGIDKCLNEHCRLNCFHCFLGLFLVRSCQLHILLSPRWKMTIFQFL